MHNVVFGLEALDELPECLHHISQIDRHAPNHVDLIGLVLGPGTGADRKGRKGMEDAGSMDHRRHDRAKKTYLAFSRMIASFAWHGWGEMYHSMQRSVTSCTSSLMTMAESLSAATMEVPGGA